MTIETNISGKRVIFSRNWFTGRASISVDGIGVMLQSPWDLRTHYSTSLMRTWGCYVGERYMLIEMKRPLLFAGLRRHTFRFCVDGQPILERKGY